MKLNRVFLYVVVLAIVILVLSGCATRITMSYMVPATHDMSNYRSLAIATAEPYRFRPFEIPSPYIEDMSGTSPVIVYSGSRVGIEKQLASYVNEQVMKEARATSYFTLASSGVADRYLNRPSQLADQGYEAYMRVWTDDLEIDEYIYAKEETHRVPSAVDPSIFVEESALVYYIDQEVRLAFSWEIRSSRNDALLASDTYSGRTSRTTEIDLSGDAVQSAPSVLPLMRDMGSRFTSSIFSQIAPSVKNVSFSLMKNDPKNRRAEDAYEAAKDGNLVEALDTFLREWKRRDHIPSLYNAALIMEALGDRDEGIELLDEGWKDTGNVKISRLLSSMKERGALDSEAQGQL
ncbi:MAG: hypothetical protein JXK93_00195 [Sphaerochaetaceae bacterium]|nr:hypothetical protein [Sphaerochaetaceae bacterium]